MVINVIFINYSITLSMEVHTFYLTLVYEFLEIFSNIIIYNDNL